MRDQTKLRAFQLADELVLLVSGATREFPREERYGLTTQLRGAAASVPSNIVEGAARRSQADYLRFLDMAFGSVREVEYQLSLAHRLGYLSEDRYAPLQRQVVETGKVLGGLIRALRK